MLEGGREIDDKQEQAKLNKEYWRDLYMAHEADERVEDDGEDIGEEGEESLGEDIEIEEVRTALKKMKKGKAVGVDDIPSEFLIEGGGEKEVLEWVTYIFNKVFKEEKIPSAWKKYDSLIQRGEKAGVGKLQGNYS